MKNNKLLKKITAFSMALIMMLPASEEALVQAQAATRLSKPTVNSVKETGNANVTVSWKKVKGAKKYQVLRSTKKNGKGAKKLSTVNKTKYVDKSTKDGKTYYYSVKAIKGKNKASSKWKRFKTSGAPVLGDLHSSVTSALENTDNEAVVSLHVKNYKRLKMSTFSLVDDSTGKSVGILNDQGINGDAIRADGYYSLRINITGMAGEKKTYSITYKKQKKETEPIAFFDDVTESDFREASSGIDTLVSSAENTIGSDTVTNRTEAEKAISAVYDDAVKLCDSGKVRTVNKSDYGVDIQFSSGIKYIYNPIYKGSDAGGDNVDLSVMGVLPYTGSTDQGIFKDEYTAENASKTVSEALNNVNYSKTIKDSDVTLKEINAFTDNEIIFWHGHGGYSEKNGPVLITGEKISENDFEKLVNTSSKFKKLWFEGVYLTAPEEDGGKSRLGIDADYIINNVKSMKNSFIYLGACYSMKDKRLVDAFAQKGACSIGNSDSIVHNYNAKCIEKFSQLMTQINSHDGNYYSIDDAITIVKKDPDIGMNDGDDTPAAPLAYFAPGYSKYRFSTKSSDQKTEPNRDLVIGTYKVKDGGSSLEWYIKNGPTGVLYIQPPFYRGYVDFKFDSKTGQYKFDSTRIKFDTTGRYVTATVTEVGYDKKTIIVNEKKNPDYE